MNTDVAIIGFGPTGAVLAGLLAKRGIRVTVIEKSMEVFPQPRAAHIDHTGLRTIQELGCLDRLIPPMIRNQSLDFVDRDHALLLRVPAGQDSISGLPTSVYFYQPHFDLVLRETVAAMPQVETRLGVEMIGFRETGSEVEITMRDVATGAEETLRSNWLVGCDGAWSPVREGMGSALENLDFDECWLVLDLRLTRPQDSLPKDRVVQVCDPDRPHLTTPLSADRQRFEFMLLPGEEPEAMRQPQSVARLLCDWLPPDGYVVERSAIYTFHGLIAEHWRKGRVLIAGDAAHQMPPFLGQGMCSGLRDAANLAWKLAAVVRGDVPQHVLDTYQSERGPHVRTIIEAAIRFGQLVCMTDPAEAAERDRNLRSKGNGGDERTAFTLPRLTPGPLVFEGGGGLFVQPVVEGRPLDDIVGSRFLVLASSRDAEGDAAKWWRETLDAHVVRAADLDDEDVVRWMDRFQASTAIVRPDRYVLGTGDDLDGMTERVKAYLGTSSRDLAPTKSVARVD